MANKPPNYLTPAEAAIKADVTRRAITTWCDRFPDLAVRVVGRWRIRPDVLNRLLAGHMPSDAGVPPRAREPLQATRSGGSK